MACPKTECCGCMSGAPYRVRRDLFSFGTQPRYVIPRASSTCSLFRRPPSKPSFIPARMMPPRAPIASPTITMVMIRGKEWFEGVGRARQKARVRLNMADIAVRFIRAR